MRRHRVLVQLDALETLVGRARHAVPDALAVLEGRRAHLDGYSGSKGDGRGGAELTSVERTADARLALADSEWWMARRIALAAESVSVVLAECGDLMGRPGAVGADRCHGGSSMPGAIEWGRPDCHELAATYPRVDGGHSIRYEGLCVACYNRRRRWLRRRTAA